jgi:hypothetical protein
MTDLWLSSLALTPRLLTPVVGLGSGALTLLGPLAHLVSEGCGGG